MQPTTKQSLPKNNTRKERVGFTLLCILLSLSCFAQTRSTLHPDTWIAPPLPPINMALFSGATFTEATHPSGKVLVFVSASMPATSLQQWVIQAKTFGAVVVMRGFTHDSLWDIKIWIQALFDSAGVKQEDTGIGVDINPVAFDQYGIQQVPALVVTQSTLPEGCDVAPAFDVVYGNISLREALQRIAEYGEAGSLTAHMHLSRVMDRS